MKVQLLRFNSDEHPPCFNCRTNIMTEGIWLGVTVILCKRCAREAIDVLGEWLHEGQKARA